MERSTAKRNYFITVCRCQDIGDRDLSGTVELNPLRCIRCEYDLRGHTATTCPECGTFFDPEQLARLVERPARSLTLWRVFLWAQVIYAIAYGVTLPLDVFYADALRFPWTATVWLAISYVFVAVELVCAFVAAVSVARRFSPCMMAYVLFCALAVCTQGYWCFTAYLMLRVEVYPGVTSGFVATFPLWIIFTPLVVLYGVPAPPEGFAVRVRTIAAQHRVLLVAGLSVLVLAESFFLLRFPYRVLILHTILLLMAWIGAYISSHCIRESAAWSNEFRQRTVLIAGIPA